jgi:hypothetical protein
VPSFPLLDIAIGLIFVYLLLSLISSSLNEGLETIVRNRANDLETGIRNLLGDKTGSWWASFLPWVNSIENQSITREFYTHPLIRNLFRNEVKLPTYIPSRNFALAVMDMAVKDGALLRGSTQDTAGLSFGPLSFVETVNKTPLPDSLKKSIDALVTAANGDAQQARLNIENWFNSSMDRVSGWYKSRTQKILFVIGVLVTVAVNADSIAIFRNLSHSKNLETVVAAAEKAGSGSLPSNQDPQTQIGKAMNELTGLDIGIGWDREAKPAGHPLSWGLQLLYLHGVGWLITAAAISLGAPFWFDTLNRFMVVRSTVKPKEKSPDEASKS